jgi:hypothetical protein
MPNRHWRNIKYENMRMKYSKYVPYMMERGTGLRFAIVLCHENVTMILVGYILSYVTR